MKTSEAKSQEAKSHVPLKLRDYLQLSISWSPTGDVTHPWAATLGDDSLVLRLNDFPDEQMYTLFARNRSREVGSFDEWPKNWKRASARLPGATLRKIVRDLVQKTGMTKTHAETAVGAVLESMQSSLGSVRPSTAAGTTSGSSVRRATRRAGAR